MIPAVTVSQKNHGEYHFQGDISTPCKIFLLQYPTDKPEQLLLETQDHDFSITIENLTSRAYFFIQPQQQAGYVIGERTLCISGMNNFRDLGGYLTKEGKRVCWGKLYRSDHLYNADAEGMAILNGLNINSIIDYRSSHEREKYPNKKLNGAVKTFHLDPNAHTAELAAQFTSEQANEDLNLVNKIIEQKEKGELIKQDDIVIKQYQNFVEKPECQQAFSQMLKIATSEHHIALLQHCRGGKDRTGFGVMLLLGLLGVPTETIIADYMLTHDNRFSRNQFKMEKYQQLTRDPVVLDYLYSLIDTKPHFIATSIETIHKKYHSFAHYAQQVLEISPAEIEQLKFLYLQ